MPKPDLANLEQLVREVIFPFYQIERHSELRFAAGRHENDAEHSWSVALFACALAQRVDPKLDVGKVCQFATVHDLTEIYAGDTSNFAPEAWIATKESREQSALQRLSIEYKKVWPWVAETVRAYERQVSDEARFVKSVDKVLLLLYDLVEKGHFCRKNKITLEQWQSTMQKHRDKAARHPGTFEYYDAIWNLLLANPQFFHPEGT